MISENTELSVTHENRRREISSGSQEVESLKQVKQAEFQKYKTILDKEVNDSTLELE